MPSPFPGMNPYLEHPGVWVDFHHTYLTFIREAIAGQVAPDYQVRIEQHVYIEDEPDDRRLIGIADADVRIEGGSPASVGGTVAVLTPPAQVQMPKVRRRKARYLTIRTGTGERVVTVLKLLSPANKDGGVDQAAYLAKRRELLAGAVSLVELDLLRGGMRMPLGRHAACDYYALVSRPPDRPTADFWPIRLRNPLPVIPIPLDPGRPEATLSLQDTLHRAYDSARYGPSLYRRPPEPRLPAEDAAWAEGLIPTSA